MGVSEEWQGGQCGWVGWGRGRVLGHEVSSVGRARPGEVLQAMHSGRPLEG